MTKEQLKQLKKGDEIFIRARYKTILDNGNVLFSHSLNYVCDRVAKTESFTHSSNVILPPPAPKYDPCRLFKKGDKVMLRKWCGRNPVIYGMNLFQLGEVLNVDEDENTKEEGLILVSNAECKQSIHACYLDLITPVEELEPYNVDHNQYGWHVEKDGEIIATYNDERRPNAKEAAEAECKRLNDEYRKEQNNETH